MNKIKGDVYLFVGLLISALCAPIFGIPRLILFLSIAILDILVRAHIVSERCLNWSVDKVWIKVVEPLFDRAIELWEKV